MNLDPLTLEGGRIRLEPMMPEHLDALVDAGGYPELWKWTSTTADTREGMAEYVAGAMRDRDAGIAMPFVTVDKETGSIIGSTRFGNIDPANRRVEIGWTWVTPGFQRTWVNSEAKFLMLRQAFEVWGCVRVELKTDALNEKSRTAMKRIGAQEEGILRQHMVTWTGRLRDSVYYSILDSEWPEVKARLEGFLSR
jgi:RimJ/RimL family protein N-acetyltransferase